MNRTKILDSMKEAMQGSRTIVITISKDAGKNFASHLVRCATEEEVFSLPDHTLWVLGKAIEQDKFDNSRRIRLVLSHKYNRLGADLLPSSICALIEQVEVMPVPLR